VSSLPARERKALAAALTPRLTEYVPHVPHPPQAAFLLTGNREVLYGGAAGGGKSDALLMAALQYVDEPGYSALLLRRTFADLALPDAIMARSHEWLRGTDAEWNERDKVWRFPSGATLTFGYLDHEADKYRYQGAAFQFVGFDELTQFTETQYRYLFSRLRRSAGSTVPLRMRAASNPGGVGHQWVYRRFFLEGRAKGRAFIPAKLEDNPTLDQASYEEGLAELDAVTRAQLLHGDWTAIDRTNAICPEWTPELALAQTHRAAFPAWLTAYRVMDVGSRDLTVVLFAYWDFLQARLYVVGEVVLRDPSTRALGEAIVRKHRELFGDHEGIDGVLSFSDIDWRLIKDLREDFGLDFSATAKADKLAAHNAARAFVGEGRLVIAPECEVLLATLSGATWNDKRTDYQRTDTTGHADAWDALVYLIRNVRRDRNPYPAHYDANPFARQKKHLSSAAQALQRGLPAKFRPL
jgi:hypothetical protein